MSVPSGIMSNSLYDRYYVAGATEINSKQTTGMLQYTIKTKFNDQVLFPE